MEQPSINIDGVKYWKVGCRLCMSANAYSFFYDGRKGFAMKCACGNTIDLSKVKFQSRPDRQPINLKVET